MHREAVYLFCVLGHLEEAVTVALEQLTLGLSMSNYPNFISIYSGVWPMYLVAKTDL